MTGRFIIELVQENGRIALRCNGNLHPTIIIPYLELLKQNLLQKMSQESAQMIPIDRPVENFTIKKMP